MSLYTFARRKSLQSEDDGNTNHFIRHSYQRRQAYGTAEDFTLGGHYHG